MATGFHGCGRSAPSLELAGRGDDLDHARLELMVAGMFDVALPWLRSFDDDFQPPLLLRPLAFVQSLAIGFGMAGLLPKEHCSFQRA